jgi:hypothetical protein
VAVLVDDKGGWTTRAVLLYRRELPYLSVVILVRDIVTRLGVFLVGGIAETELDVAVVVRSVLALVRVAILHFHLEGVVGGGGGSLGPRFSWSNVSVSNTV